MDTIPEMPIKPTAPEVRNVSTIPWGDTTNPTNHTSTRYRYLIHAINPVAADLIGSVRQHQLEMEEGKDIIDKNDGDQSINLLRTPERLADRVSLSCSLIDQNHNATWGNVGLIINAPEPNVIISSPTDAGVAQMSKKLLLEQASTQTLLPADKVLEQTNPDVYNEVVVIANDNGQQVSLAGFFFKTTSDGTPLNRFLYETIKQQAERLHLPLVPIVEPNPYSEDGIIRGEGFFYVTLNGKRVALEGEVGSKFVVEDGENKHSYFASPQEMDQVFHYLQEHNMEIGEILRLQKSYQEADKARQLPQIFIDDKGDILSIKKSLGYGEDGVQVRIGTEGYVKTNVFEESERDAAGLNTVIRTRHLLDDDITNMTDNEAEQVIQEALTNAPEEQREKIRKWWNNVQTTINNQRNSRNTQLEAGSRMKALLDKLLAQ